MVKPVRQISNRILFILCIVVIVTLAVGVGIPACAGSNVTPSVTVAYKPAPTLHIPIVTQANLPGSLQTDSTGKSTNCSCIYTIGYCGGFISGEFQLSGKADGFLRQPAHGYVYRNVQPI